MHPHSSRINFEVAMHDSAGLGSLKAHLLVNL